MELKKSSCARLEHDVAQLRRRIDGIRAENARDAQTSDAALAKQKEHEKLVEEVKMMNTYRESNSFLQANNEELVSKEKAQPRNLRVARPTASRCTKR